MKRFYLVILLFCLPNIMYADTISGDQKGFETIEKGVNNGSKSVGNMIADVVAVVGIAAIFLGFWFMFSNKGREDPEIRKKGFKMFLVGAIFAAGAGLTIANMVTKQVVNESNATVKGKWDESWTKD